MRSPAPFSPCPLGLSVVARLAQAHGAVMAARGFAVRVLTLAPVHCPGLEWGPTGAAMLDFRRFHGVEKNSGIVLDTAKALDIMRVREKKST